jgi:uncharacterized protein YqjF (DUF2071 family)
MVPQPPIVRRPVMYQHWRELTFLHWRYPVADVQALLPDGLVAQEFDGSAWVGLVPFLMDRVRAPFVPPAPWLSRFPETNVRTYVTAPDGTEGIWFFSLDAARLPAVLAGRTTFRLPYVWARMSVTARPDEFRYRSARYASRRWPAATSAAAVRRGAAVTPGPLEYFLTYRFRLYSVLGGRLVTAAAAHPPWPLYGGTVRALADDLVPAAGLAVPAGEPLVHTSPGVAVRIGAWHPVRS